MKTNFLFVTLSCGLLVVCPTRSNPVTSDSTASAFYYLLNFGYIEKSENTNTAQLQSEEVVSKAIKDFQVFAGLDPTGRLDAETVELMNTPRCGIKDSLGPSSHARRRKRYALQGSRWSVRTLTYRISKYPSSDRLSKLDIDNEIKSAFQIWSDVTDLKFERKDSGSVHIDIRFEQGAHGDGDPFDGPGGTLAHAFFPQFGGDAHFDDEEYWTINEFRGTNLKQTAAHELGHSLGLSHSDVRSALMAPFYRGWVPNLKLDTDDVEAIQALYGKPTNDIENPPAERPATSTTTSTTTKPSPVAPGGEDLCKNDRIDAIFNIDSGDYFVFQGSKYWKLNEESVEPGYPRLISDDWPGLPNNIDTAVTWPENGMTYFFKGSEYWKFKNMQAQEGYPKPIEDGFPRIPSNLDAAFVWAGNGKIYFFKDDSYYKFDPTRNQPVSDSYPRDIKNWGLPGKIDAAVQWMNKYTYFFRQEGYYRFNDRKFDIDKSDIPYPRPIGKWWFGCPDTGNFKVTSFSGNNRRNNNNNILNIRALRKTEARAKLLFAEEGDEVLDAEAADDF